MFTLILTALLSTAAIALAATLASLARTRKLLRAQTTAHTALQSARQLDHFRTARRDNLTHLPNRQAFLETLAAPVRPRHEIHPPHRRSGQFDRLNANLGQAIADELLEAVAARLQSHAERDHAARLHGDTFALLLSAQADADQTQAAIARVAASLAAPYQVAGQLIDASASIGVAHAPLHGAAAETLLRAAQSALAQAKQKGPGRTQICGDAQTADILARQRARRELQNAIGAGQIVPYYQPIVRLGSAEIASFEVLARWIHPEHGVLLPEQFIPAADEMGLAGQITMSLLRQVAADTQDWPAWCRYAINVSPGQVRELIFLLNTQPGNWQRRMDLTRLDVEISEAALTQDRALARELIDVLHEQGARAVLDDFGSASNFFHLRDMPFDSIKIGKTFIQTLAHDTRAEACVMSMLWLGHGLGIDIVADGVETTEVAERLASLGCTFAQGYLYARPGPAPTAAKLLSIETEVLILEAA